MNPFHMSPVVPYGCMVSVTVQLVNSTQEINGFLRKIRDAPKELLWLILLLEQLYDLLEGVKSVLQQRQCQDGDIDVTGMIMAVLNICEGHLEQLYEALQNTRIYRNSSFLPIIISSVACSN
jgi:hypothetical protein